MSTTLVVQSYRTRNVPEWIARCIQSVMKWAKVGGHHYEFVDDTLFDLLPKWYRDRCGAQILPQTDLARLILMRDRLHKGYTSVIWIDADILIFAHEHLRIESRDGFAFCYEMWIEADGNGSYLTRGPAINNAVMVMDANNPMLDFYIHACQAIVKLHPAGAIGRLDAGTLLLSRLGSVLALPLIQCVGLLSPPITREVAQGGGTLCSMYATAFGRKIGAANLCASLRDVPINGVALNDAEYACAVDVLERTCGDVINRYLAWRGVQCAG
jgi:hypothetical protein